MSSVLELYLSACLTGACAFFFTPHEMDPSAAVFPSKRGWRRAPDFEIWFLSRARSQLSESDALDTVALQPQTAATPPPENQRVHLELCFYWSTLHNKSSVRHVWPTDHDRPVLVCSPEPVFVFVFVFVLGELPGRLEAAEPARPGGAAGAGSAGSPQPWLLGRPALLPSLCLISD